MKNDTFYQKIKSSLLAVAGSFLIAAGWGWYHLSKHPWSRFYLLTAALWVGVLVVWLGGTRLYLFVVRRLGRHPFWYTDFSGFLNELFFVSSLFFVIFFFRSELTSVVYVSAIFALLYNRVSWYLSHHPAPQDWLAVNKAYFLLGYFLFLVQAALQYAAYHYYILDSNIRFFNIVLFRAVAMTLFWLLGYVVAGFLFSTVRNRIVRFAPFLVWIVTFIFFLIFWVVNVGILYYSGLYFSPNNLQHAFGSGDLLKNSIFGYLVAGAIVVFVLFLKVFRAAFRLHTAATRRLWRMYSVAVGVAAVILLAGLTSFKNTPEHAVFSSFYDYYAGTEVNYTLSPAIQKKLERFGLVYDPNNFYVNERPFVYSPSSTSTLLPSVFRNTKPNILIVFWESFSARLNDVYNSAFTDLTPGLDAFAADSHTTIFQKYYNASTPTITGTLSQLCSFLPPTGHNEIQEERKMQNHHLLCLPEVLKKYAGFKSTSYVTAVDKEFAHKDGIFTSAGVDKIYGTSELAKIISGEPLSWGYSDHQMFPAVWGLMQKAAQPFLMMLATVDSHPPFNLAKDGVNYRDGSQSVLNSYHTTDDAFLHFWNEFKVSPFYNNTMVMVVADHAIFPGALSKDIATWPGHADTKSAETYYDQNTFLMYVPQSVLPKTVEMYSSGIDELPTLLQIFGINIPNSFEGHSIFDDRKEYPNLLGMHELGLYINQVNSKNKRQIDYNVPTEIQCPSDYVPSSTPDLTLCDYNQFYKWKRQMFEEGRFWKH